MRTGLRSRMSSTLSPVSARLPSRSTRLSPPSVVVAMESPLFLTPTTHPMVLFRLLVTITSFLLRLRILATRLVFSDSQKRRVLSTSRRSSLELPRFLMPTLLVAFPKQQLLSRPSISRLTRLSSRLTTARHRVGMMPRNRRGVSAAPNRTPFRSG